MSQFNVAKFGGTSVADFQSMSRCAEIIKKNPNTKLVVISACAGVTNGLVKLALGLSSPEEQADIISNIRQIHQYILAELASSDAVEPYINAILEDVTEFAAQAHNAPSNKLTDKLVACGELMSTYLLTQILKEQGINAVRFDIRDVLKTDATYGKAQPQLEQTAALAQQHLLPLCADSIVITQGFIGQDEQGNTTTLGRGGSDYSAALIAEAVKASGLEIWTDVPGIYTTDPRISPQAYPIDEISFSEASEMANFGAKILHPATLLPALRQQIPVFVGSSREPQKGGTWVKESVQSAPPFRALALRDNQTMVTLHSQDMFQTYGFLAQVFTILAKYKISVDLITTSEVSVALTLDQTNTSGEAPQLPADAKKELEALCQVNIEHNLSVVALIGNKMSKQTGYAKQVFSSLEAFNLRMICYGASPHNLCFLVSSQDAPNAVRRLHEVLFE